MTDLITPENILGCFLKNIDIIPKLRFITKSSMTKTSVVIKSVQRENVSKMLL